MDLYVEYDTCLNKQTNIHTHIHIFALAFMNAFTVNLNPFLETN